MFQRSLLLPFLPPYPPRRPQKGNNGKEEGEEESTHLTPSIAATRPLRLVGSNDAFSADALARVSRRTRSSVADSRGCFGLTPEAEGIDLRGRTSGAERPSESRRAALFLPRRDNQSVP